MTPEQMLAAPDLGAQRRQSTGRETMVEVGDDADDVRGPRERAERRTSLVVDEQRVHVLGGVEREQPAQVREQKLGLARSRRARDEGVWPGAGEVERHDAVVIVADRHVRARGAPRAGHVGRQQGSARRGAQRRAIATGGARSPAAVQPHDSGKPRLTRAVEGERVPARQAGGAVSRGARDADRRGQCRHARLDAGWLRSPHPDDGRAGDDEASREARSVGAAGFEHDEGEVVTAGATHPVVESCEEGLRHARVDVNTRRIERPGPASRRRLPGDDDGRGVSRIVQDGELRDDEFEDLRCRSRIGVEMDEAARRHDEGDGCLVEPERACRAVAGEAVCGWRVTVPETQQTCARPASQAEPVAGAGGDGEQLVGARRQTRESDDFRVERISDAAADVLHFARMVAGCAAPTSTSATAVVEVRGHHDQRAHEHEAQHVGRVHDDRENQCDGHRGEHRDPAQRHPTWGCRGRGPLERPRFGQTVRRPGAQG